jgi:hypothetical protein
MYENEKRYLLRKVEQFFGSGASKEEVEGVTICKGSSTDLLLKRLGELGVILCGGALTSLFSNTPISDLDLYVENSENLGDVKTAIKEYFGEPVFVSENAETYSRRNKGSNKKYSVQLITRFTGPPSAIFSNFDFTITMGCYSFAEEGFVLHERFLADIAKRRLVYSGGSQFPICAMYRTKKYQARGYTLPGSTIMHIALSIVRLDIKGYKELKQQLLGIDTSMLQNLLDSPKYRSKIEGNVPIDYGEFIEDAFKKIEGDTDLEAIEFPE